jgi:hypothetical protein
MIIKNIFKVLYGLSENLSIDITSQINNYFLNNDILHKKVNINSLSNQDPYIGIEKKIFIYENTDSLVPIVINECNSYLSDDIYYKNHDDIHYIKRDDIYYIKCDDIYEKVLIYIIYHDDKSYKQIEKYKDYKWIKLYYNESTKYFESNIFNYLRENKDEWINKEYVGMITYSFERKTNQKIDDIIEKLYIQLIIKKNNHQLITFIQDISMYGNFHGKIKDIFDYVLVQSKFGFDLPIEYNIPTFYCNYWITLPILMDKYLDFQLKFLEKLEDKSDEHLQSMLNSDVEYEAGTLSVEKLIQISGYPYYTNHCFVMERLPCIFFWKHNIISYQLT